MACGPATRGDRGRNNGHWAAELREKNRALEARIAWLAEYLEAFHGGGGGEVDRESLREALAVARGERAVPVMPPSTAPGRTE